MKLLKKLLPLSALATVSTAAPIVSSCSKLSTYSWTLTDESKEVQYETKPVGGSLNDVSAQETYFRDVAANPRILAEDLLFEYLSIVEASNEDPKSIGSFTVTIAKVDTINKTISYQIYMKGKTVVDKKDVAFEQKIIIENMHFYIKHQSQEPIQWKLFPPEIHQEELVDDSSWSLTVYTSQPSKEELFKLNSSNLTLADPEDVAEAFNQIGISSVRYLSETEYVK